MGSSPTKKAKVRARIAADKENRLDRRVKRTLKHLEAQHISDDRIMDLVREIGLAPTTTGGGRREG